MITIMPMFSLRCCTLPQPSQQPVSLPQLSPHLSHNHRLRYFVCNCMCLCNLHHPDKIVTSQAAPQSKKFRPPQKSQRYIPKPIPLELGNLKTYSELHLYLCLYLYLYYTSYRWISQTSQHNVTFLQ